MSNTLEQVVSWLLQITYDLTFLVLEGFISAFRDVCLLDNLGDIPGVQTPHNVFNEGEDTCGF